MKLTPRQIDYFNRERDKLIYQIELKRKHDIHDGLFLDLARMEAFKLVSELHNLELNNTKPVKTLQFGGKDVG